MQHHKDTKLQTWLRASLIVLSLGIGGCVDEDDSLMDELGEADEFRAFNWEPVPPLGDAMVKENQASTNFGGANLAMRTNSSANSVSSSSSISRPTAASKASLSSSCTCAPTPATSSPRPRSTAFG